jgi:hypothetical protein
MATKFKSKLFYGKTGFFDSVGIGVSEPENGLHISGADFKLESGQAYFQYRPLVSGFPVMLSGDTISIDVSDLYPADNPSGFITGLSVSELADANINNPVSGQSLVYNGVVWSNEYVTGQGGGATSSADIIDLLFKDSFDNYYNEFSYNISGEVTGVGVWTDNSKTTQLFSKQLLYSGENLTGVLTVDKTNFKSLTKALLYDGDNNLISTTRIYT